MTNSLSSFLGPLDKQACLYFYFLTVVFFFMVLVAIIFEVYFIIMHFNKLNFRQILSGVVMIINLFLVYFVNRLLYTMCSRSLA